MRSTHLLTCNREEVRLHRPWPAWAVPAVWESVPESSTDPDSWVQWVQPTDALHAWREPYFKLTGSWCAFGQVSDYSLSYVTLSKVETQMHIFSRGSSHAHTMKLSNLGELFSDMSIIKIIEVTGTGVKAKLSWIN